jgi:hypothetical protein
MFNGKRRSGKRHAPPTDRASTENAGPHQEHVPPDVTSQIFWLKNRKPHEWRDVQNIEHAIGKYIISDRPMTEEEWIRERATVVDVTPTPIEDKT